MEARRAEVWAKGAGRVGYLHVPDMERLGFSEFHRHWDQERGRGALVVDLRGARAAGLARGRE